MRTITVKALIKLDLEIAEDKSIELSESTVEEALNWGNTKVIKVFETYPKVKKVD